MRGGSVTPPTNCLFTGSTTSGSCISTGNTSQFLSSGSGFSIEFSTTDPFSDCASWSHTNCLYVWQTSTPSGSPWYPVGGIISGHDTSIAIAKAILCNGDTTPSGNHFYYMVNDYGGATTWFSINGSSIYQTAAPCSGATHFNYFAANGAFNYASLTDACSSVTASGTVEAKAMPAGVPFWSSNTGRPALTQCLVSVAGVVVTLDSGYISVGGSCDGGAGGALCVNAANVTINGAGAEVSGFDEAIANNAINMKRDLANNTTIEGTAGNYFVIDCLPSFGGGNDSIESGANVGNTTIAHVKIQNCGGGVSGAHSVYLSWGGDPFPSSTFCHTVSDLLVIDSAGDTPAIKFDDQCESGQGTLIDSAIYCTSSGAGGQCSENQPYDEQCGGNQLVQNNLLEQYGSIASSPDASYMAKVAWGYLGIGGCPNYPTSGTDAIRFDKDIFIYDGVKDLIAGGTVTTACGGFYAHQYCNANSSGSNVTSTTSLTVGTGFRQLMVPPGTAILDGTPVTIFNGANSMLGTVDMGYSCGRDAGVYTCFTGAISGSVLTVSATDNGPTGEQCGTYANTTVSCTLAVGQVVSGTSVPASTIITAQLTGSSGDTCPAADCNGQKGTYSISTSGTVSAEFMGAHGYDSASGNLLVYVSTIAGSGSFNSWTVNYNKATGVCVTNSEIIGSFNSGNPSSDNSQMIMGQGDYTDSGCTGTGSDTNTYYDTANATTHNGRHDACAVLSQIANSGWTNCNTAPNSHGAFPYVPDYTQNPPTQATQAAEAATLGCSGAGTAASPITACP